MKRPRIRFLGPLTIIVIVSLIAQMALPGLAFARSQAVPPAVVPSGSHATSSPAVGDGPKEPSLASKASQLDRLLAELETTPDDAFDATLSKVDDAWQAMSVAEAQAQTSLAETGNNASARGLEKARRRVDQLAQGHESRLADLSARYQALRDVAKTDRRAARDAAAELRSALRADMAPLNPPPPDLDLLPNRPGPAARPVDQYPPLSNAAPTAEEAHALAMAAATPPTPADLLSTEDAAQTPEIQALASELGRDPVKIYEYVRNKISFEPYYGSRKGALLTLWERSGNDIDIASLLIALLRASGYYTRYMQGIVAVDGPSAQNWVGNAPDLATAASILATGGVPVGLTVDGYLVKEHVWAEIYDPDRSSLDFNFNGIVDVGDIQIVAAALGTTNPYFDRNGNGTVDVNDVDLVAAGWKQPDTGATWQEVDASFKQFEFFEPANLAPRTGFDVPTWVAQVRGSTTISDTLQAMYNVPKLPSADLPGQDDNDREFADVKMEEAVAATVAYIEANPDMTNADLLGGAYIVPAAFTALPASLPFIVWPGSATAEYGEIPAALRDKVTIQLYSEYGDLALSHQASFPGLANKRVTVSYEAATPEDQATIDSYGGTLLTTPPIVDLVPVLKVNGAEVARGAAVPMGTRQIRSLTFTDANGYSSTVQNAVSAGDTFAVGLAHGRTSAAAIEAAQKRLADARAALPQTPEGDPDVDAPQNMSEPIIGEMLNVALLAYFNQLDTYSELVARSQHIRWFRYLSAGVAMQNLVFGYCWGAPCQTRGGGMGFDIQQNVVSTISLRNQPADERVFMQTTGMFGSTLENSLFENVGRGSVSTMRLLSLALARGIPVYRIDASNRAEILPKLALSPWVESAIVNALDSGRVVTVPEQELAVNDWSGVGFIVLDPVSGAAGYMISGGLFGNTDTISGGSLWDILKTVGAYAWLAINFGLDLWGVWAGIALLLVPEPTLLTKLAGIGLIVANLVALGFDVADLSDLISGDLSASQYVGEQVTGLIIQAILARVGLKAAARIIDDIGPSAISKVVSQIDNLTDGLASRLIGRGFDAADVVRMTERGLTSREALQAMDDVANRFGLDDARRLLSNDWIAEKGALEAVARAARDAPDAAGLDDTIAKAISRNDFGYAYELRRAATHAGVGDVVEGYGRQVDVDFQRITGFDANGNPILGALDRQALEGDIVLNGDRWIDAKHGPVGNQDLRIWNQIQKAQAAIDQGLISEFTFEASSSVGQFMRDWAARNAPDVRFNINLGDGFQ